MLTVLDKSPVAQTGSGSAAPTVSVRAPRLVLWATALAIGGLVAGAMYLMVVRGDALMLDLSVFQYFCS